MHARRHTLTTTTTNNSMNNMAENYKCDESYQLLHLSKELNLNYILNYRRRDLSTVRDFPSITGISGFLRSASLQHNNVCCAQ